MSASVRTFKKPGGRNNLYSIFKGFFCANVHFEAKLSKVVGEEVDPSFYVGPGFF